MLNHSYTREQKLEQIEKIHLRANAINKALNIINKDIGISAQCTCTYAFIF